MTTEKQIRSLLAPLVERHDDMRYVRRQAFISPIGHIFKGLILDASQDKRKFYAMWFLIPLLKPATQGSLEYCGRFGHSWSIDEPGIDARLFANIEFEHLSDLRKVDLATLLATVKRKSTWIEDKSFFDSTNQAAWVHAANGDFDDASAICQRCETAWPRLKESPQRDTVEPILMRLWPPLKLGDKAAVAAVLHEVEREMVFRRRIEEYWEKTPFPALEGLD